MARIKLAPKIARDKNGSLSCMSADNVCASGDWTMYDPRQSTRTAHLKKCFYAFATQSLYQFQRFAYHVRYPKSTAFSFSISRCTCVWRARTYTANIFYSPSPHKRSTREPLTKSTMASHPDTKIDCSKVYVKKSLFSNAETGEFDGAFAACPIKKGRVKNIAFCLEP
jgi:hypothetical protein